jgi:choline-sulfatase
MGRKKRRKQRNPRPAQAREKTAAPAKADDTAKPAGSGPGRRRTVVLVAAGAAVLAGLALAYFAGIVPGRASRGLPPKASLNVLLITLDTTRADHLGCYGDAAARTPALDALAAAGIRFDRVYCPAPLTLPSHTSILTGLYPLKHGVRNNGHPLPEGIRTLTEILKAQGYATAAFVSSFSVDSRFGLGRGFDVYDDTFQSQQSLKTMNEQRRAEETFDRFSRWLDKVPPGRFFCWVHYYDPHLPYDPPSPYKEEFADRPYDGEIAYMDRYVGALMDRLGEKGLRDKTLVVVAGDHGEGLGDKVELGHGIFLYEETLRVPLLIQNQGVIRRPGVIGETVRLVDVAPTILDILGLGAETAGMQGQSFAGWLRGSGRRDRDSVVETVFPRENFGWSELVGLVSGPWKYIQAPKPELYDLAHDPGENRNLAGAEADREAALRSDLEAELVRLGSGGAAAGKAARTSRETAERLRSLGYVNFAPARPGAEAADPKDKIGLLKLIQQAQALQSAKKLAEAEAAYAEIVQAMPDSLESYVHLAIVQAERNRLDKALETLRRAQVRLPDSELLLVRLGITYAAAGKTQEALDVMAKVLAVDPDNVDALTVSGNLLDTGGRREEARAYYERALAIEPESRFLRLNYAANLAAAGRMREALAIYKGLVEDFPEEPGFSLYAGITSSFLGEYGPAIQFLERAVAMKPTPLGYFNLAVASEKSGRLDDAAKYLRLYLGDTRGEKEANIAQARAELERLEKRSRRPRP